MRSVFLAIRHTTPGLQSDIKAYYNIPWHKECAKRRHFIARLLQAGRILLRTLSAHVSLTTASQSSRRRSVGRKEQFNVRSRSLKVLVREFRTGFKFCETQTYYVSMCLCQSASVSFPFPLPVPVPVSNPLQVLHRRIYLHALI